MTSIGKKNTLRITSSAATGDSICLVLTNDVDDDSIVLIYSDSENPSWSRLSVDYEVVGVCVTPTSLQGMSRYVCVTSSGEAIFVTSDPIVERINAEGAYQRIGTGTGMLSEIRLIDERLVAMGRGGQVYFRSDTATWAPASPTYPVEEHRDDHINLWAGDKGPSAGTLVFGGMSVPPTDDGGERARLLIAGDMDAYKRALRQIRRNYGTLWILSNDGWTKIPLPATATITDLLNVPKRGLFASTSLGSVSRVLSEDEIEAIYVNPSPSDITDLSMWNDKLVILHSGALIAHGFEPGTEVTLETPGDFQMMTAFHSNDHVTWLIDGRGFARWTGDDWQEITIPAALMR